MTSIASHLLLLFGLASPEGAAPASDGKVPVRAATSLDAVPGAASDESRVAAQAALADGNRLLKEGDVAGAIEDYRRAQRLHPPAAPKIEFNIAKAEAARGDEPAAVTAFERFLAQSLEIPADFREEARNELHRLSAALGALQLAEKRPGLLVVIDGRARGKTPVEGGLWVRPGRHVITIEEGDRELFRNSIDVEAGARVRITVTMDSPPPDGQNAQMHQSALALGPRPPPPDPLVSSPMVSSSGDVHPGTDGRSPIWKRWWFWTAVGAVAVAGTATAAIRILGSRSDCPSTATCISISPPPPSPP